MQLITLLIIALFRQKEALFFCQMLAMLVQGPLLMVKRFFKKNMYALRLHEGTRESSFHKR